MAVDPAGLDPAGSWPPATPSAAVLASWVQLDGLDVDRLGEPVPASAVGVGEVADGQAGDFDLVEQIAAYEQIISWARFRQLEAVHALAGRASMNPTWPVPVSQPNIAAEEIAARLGASRTLGRELVEAARLFDRQLCATGAALEAGDIDWGKAKIIIAALRDVPGQVAVAVQDRVLPTAGRRTHPQLRADLQRALITVDPLDAELRTARAADARRVCHPKVLSDGMAGIWAVWPAAVATAIDTTLTARAHAAHHSGDPRTIDQLRADTLADTLLSYDTANPSTSTTDTGAGIAGTAGDGTSRSPRWGDRRVRINVTVALTTLLGLDEHPGDLTGYGAITAQTARQLAITGTWRRLVTDPLSGTILDVGTHRYRPPANLAEIIRARDQHCVSLICGATAEHCDLDHRQPFHPDGTGGPTSADNLEPLCRRDHLLKTHGGWHLDKTGPVYTWTTPTGHTYTYRPDPPPGTPGPDEPADDDPDPSVWDVPPPF